MRKFLISLYILTLLPVYAFQPVLKNDYNNYLKNEGFNQIQIQLINQLNKERRKNIVSALNISRNYRKNNPNLTKQEYNDYLNKMLNKIEKEYEDGLSEFLNREQKYKVLKFNSRTY